MAQAFTPRFVDLVRNITTTVGTGNFVLGPAVSGFTSFAAAVQPGESFYYSCIGTAKTDESEVGRGTMQADGTISRDPISGTLTDFTAGPKSISLIAAAEWFTRVDQEKASGGAIDVADRAALAAVGVQAGGLRLLSERRREGVFSFDGSDLSALVAADVRQAVYVAPASDPTGASGAWVRRREADYLHIDWFGAAGDGVTDDSAAFVALRTLAGALATDAATGVRRGPKIKLGRGTYFLAGSFDCKGWCGDWEGEGGGFALFANSGTTTIKMASGATWYFQRGNTEGNSTGSTIAYGCDGSTFRNITWQGAGKGSGTASLARMRARVYLYNCRFIDAGGHGLEISAIAGGGTTLEGNANLWAIDGCSFYNNGKSGLAVGVNGASADVNAGAASNCDFSGNSEFGFEDRSFLGNSYIGCHSASNGLTDKAIANHAGKIYMVVAGQEAGASTNAPSGTTADNPWWYYFGAGTSQYGRAWATGLSWIAGGAYRTSGTVAPIALAGCYSESGQGPAQLGSQTKWDGGTNGAGIKGGTRVGGSFGSLMVEAGGLRSYYPSTASDMKFGAAAGDIIAAAGNGYTNTAYLRQVGADVYTQIGNGIADRDSVWTGVGTAYQMGTGGNVGYGVRAFAKLAVGDGTFNFDNARRHMTMAAAPASGTWARGDVVYNRDPSAGGKLGWVCVTGGAPGTWKAFGTVDP